MEVKRGYKQTEAGVIPEDWQATALGRHATFKTGPFGSTLHKSDYVEGGVPVINPMQIVDGKLCPTPTMAISEVAARQLSEFRLAAGNVVIGRRGEMGRCAYVRIEHHGWLCGTGSMIVRTGPSLDGQFLQSALSSPPIVAAIVNTSVGTTMVNLNRGTLSNLLIPLPPTRTEQESIAGALSDANALVEAQEQLVAKKRQIRHGAMQELLSGQKRLPGFAKSSRYTGATGQSHVIDLGPLPEDWVIRPLVEVGRWYSGGTPSMKNPAYWSGDVPWVSPKDMKVPRLYDAVDHISERAVADGTRVLPAGTVLMVIRGMILAHSFPVARAERPVAFNQDMKALVVHDSIDSNYVLYWLINHAQKLRGLTTESTHGTKRLPPDTLYRVPFPLPPTRAEQEAIAAVLSDIDGEIATLESKLAKARQVKQGMMQELLTGRIRLV